MNGFQPLNPRNLGNVVDVHVSAETRAFNAIENYIESLKQQVGMFENLRDQLSLIILELIKEIRSRETEDFVLLGRLKDIEDTVKAL